MVGLPADSNTWNAGKSCDKQAQGRQELLQQAHV